ncbi:MAG: hypothetical protein GF372_14460 [Candidatus Marinimicrobia bacterium]|nr:hypothetical protein [Candidatus Neomarinimicrobiota bacterium]
MKKILVLFALLFFYSTVYGQVNLQVGVSGGYTDFYNHSAAGFGGSAKVALLLHQVVALGVETGYREFSFNKSEVAIYGTAVLYLRNTGLRPFVSYGIGHHQLSGYYTGINIPFALRSKPETFWDTRTGIGARIGGGVRYPIGGANYLDVGFIYENQKQLIDNLKVQLGLKRVF